jgi:hypothetical protein
MKFKFHNRNVPSHRRYYYVSPHCFDMGLRFICAAPVLHEVDSGWQLQLWG